MSFKVQKIKTVNELIQEKKYEKAYALCEENIRQEHCQIISIYKMAKIFEETKGAVGNLKSIIASKNEYFDFLGEVDLVSKYKKISSILDKSIMKAGMESGDYVLNSLGTKKPIENKPIIYALSCVWGRDELTRVFLDYYKKFRVANYEKIDFRIFVVGSEGEKTQKIVEEYGFEYLEHANIPLNEKWEAGINALKNKNADAVILLGSDDFITNDFLDVYLSWLNEGVLAAGFTDGYFLDLSDPVNFIYWAGYGGMKQNAGMPSRVNETMGMGRFYSKELLELLGYSLWSGEPINRGLDGRAKTRLLNFGFRCVNEDGLVDYQGYKIGQLGISMREKNIFALDIKYPEVSVTPIKNYLRSLNGSMRISSPLQQIKAKMSADLSEKLVVMNRNTNSKPFYELDDAVQKIKKYSDEQLFDFLKNQINIMFTRVDHGLPDGEKGRLFAWYWGYYGRALLDLYRATGLAKYENLFLDTASRLIEQRDDNLNLVDEERGRVLASWGSRYSNGKRSCEITSAGLIALPMAEYCSLFGNTTLSHEVIKILNEFVGEAKESAAGLYFHHLSDDIVEPLNHANLYASALAHASKIKNSPESFKSISLGIYKYFKHFVTVSKTGLSRWPYAPKPTDDKFSLKAEAIWKAGASIELPVALYETGLIKESDSLYTSLPDQILKNNLFKSGDVPKFIDDDLSNPVGKKEINTSLPGFLSSYIQLNNLDLTTEIMKIVEMKNDYFPNDWLGEIYPEKGGSRSMIMAYAHLRLNFPHFFD